VKSTPHPGRLLLAAIMGGAACNDCLVEGTPVLTPNGARPIEQLAVGDAVWSWSVGEGQRVARRVTRVLKSSADHYLSVELDDGRRLSLTDAHPLWCPSSSAWQVAGSLAVGAAVWVVDETGAGRSAAVVSVVRHAGPASVVNLSVDGDENYLAQGVLVHNKSLKHSGIDSGLTEQANTPPTVRLEGPTDADTLTAGVPSTFTARIADAEDGPQGLSLAWTSSLDGALQATDAAVTADGAWRGSLQLSEGSHTLTLMATDSAGASASDTVAVVVGAAR